MLIARHTGKRLPVKQFERKLTAKLLIFPVGKADKHSKIEDMGSNAIADFQIGFQMGDNQGIQIKALTQYIL